MAGALANKPHNGGAAWTRLSWLLGFSRLGFDVLFVEEISRDASIDRAGVPVPLHQSANLAYFRSVTEAFGLGGRAALLPADGGEGFGLSWDEVRRRAAGGVLINISGNLKLPALKSLFATRAFIDLDPGYTQLWHQAKLSTHLDGHDYYFTVGENIGRGARIPDAGVHWRPIRQPVLLDAWPVCAATTCSPRFTTIGSWRGPYGPVSDGATTFGLKAHEFRKFVELPARVRPTLEIALDIDATDRADRIRLGECGWRVVDPRLVAGDPAAFRRYVQASSAEFSVAQGIYVETGSGWFSDRTTRYLASGRPALVQDTGLRQNYPVGEGLIVFSTFDEAVQGIEAIERDYERHARAARAIAEEYFDARRVISGLAATIGLTS